MGEDIEKEGCYLSVIFKEVSFELRPKWREG